MTIGTTYRGHEIRYNDNSEEWYCSDLQGKSYSNASLSRIKANIDKMYLGWRKASSVECLEIGYGGVGRHAEITDARITEYIGPIHSRNYKTGNTELTSHKVAVSALRRENNKVSRQEKSLDDLAPPTTEVREAYEAYSETYRQAEEMLKKAEAMRLAIPRLTLEDISELVKIKEEGGEA